MCFAFMLQANLINSFNFQQLHCHNFFSFIFGSFIATIPLKFSLSTPTISITWLPQLLFSLRALLSFEHTSAKHKSIKQWTIRSKWNNAWNVNTFCEEMQKLMLPFIMMRRNKKTKIESIHDLDSMWCNINRFYWEWIRIYSMYFFLLFGE